MQLIPNWRNWWRRYSTWLLAAGGTLTTLQAQLPAIQQYLPDGQYKAIMIGLFVLTFVAVHMPQPSVSGGDK